MKKTKPLKVLFDANPIVNGNKSGVGYYTYNLIESLAQNYPEEIVLVGHYFDFLGRKNNIDLPTNPNISYKKSILVPGKILSITRKIGFQPPLEFFFKQKGDVALFTNFVSLPSLLRIPICTAVHDLCYEEVPEFVSDKNREFLHNFVPKSVKQSRKIITISESTKLAIKKFYNVDEKNILITPIPPKAPVFRDKTDLKNLNINKKYILFVSNIEPRKNFINLVKAYELLPKKVKSEYSLVLVGGIGWKVEEHIKHIESAKQNGEDIILTGYVSDEEKSSLYTNASLFVMPSHYEGFGMPVLEAMSYDIPVIASDIPVFHEVAGDSVLYFDKDNPTSIANTIKKVISDTAISKNLVTQGRKKLKEYSWKDVSKKLFEDIKSF